MAKNSTSASLKQAVVIVHGMGEQRPLETLNMFIDAAIPGTTKTVPGSHNPVFYSRPIPHSDSYEQRFYLARKTDKYPQTEFYEYHWSHMMQGNKLGDMWDTFSRMLFQFPWKVPSGLKVVWFLFWALIAGLVWAVFAYDLGFSDLTLAKIITAVAGGGVLASALVWAFTKFIPGKITSSFVDVVRYLDTSPRSYGARRAIRKGMVQFLKDLHDEKDVDGKPRYDRIILVAHSLGAYIAYDAISYLWGQVNQDHLEKKKGLLDPKLVKKFEMEAQTLLNDPTADPAPYRALQREMFKAMRDLGSPWRISDFVSVGTPMYMADQLMTRKKQIFDERVDRKEIVTCPPQPDAPGNKPDKSLYTYPYLDGTVLYHAAPFALTRWSNMWFPAHGGFFGDWFGGPLRPLFGAGIKDVRLKGNGWRRFLPAWAHAIYFKFASDETAESATTKLHELMELDPKVWWGKKPKK